MAEELSGDDSLPPVSGAGASENKTKDAKEKKHPLSFSAWTIGFDGLSAIVDKEGVSSHGNASVSSLLAAGLYRAAAAAAVNSGSDDAVMEVIDSYNRACTENRSPYKPSDIYRLFGVQKVRCERFILL